MRESGIHTQDNLISSTQMLASSNNRKNQKWTEAGGVTIGVDCKRKRDTNWGTGTQNDIHNNERKTDNEGEQTSYS